MARFTKNQCRPRPDRLRGTSSREGARKVGFPPRELRDLQVRVRTEQQTPEWKARYGSAPAWTAPSTSSPTDTACAIATAEAGPKAHLQHLLTAVAVNIERLSARPEAEQTSSPRHRQPPSRPSLTSKRSSRSKSWRTLGGSGTAGAQCRQGRGPAGERHHGRRPPAYRASPRVAHRRDRDRLVRHRRRRRRRVASRPYARRDLCPVHGSSPGLGRGRTTSRQDRQGAGIRAGRLPVALPDAGTPGDRKFSGPRR
ncbi:hypothetical protein GT354_22300 [Streptomyces sp. SID3343]|nr:hypothetical protein [Streptomyces sp. SID3343]